jgi:hypothetical protein
LKRCGKPAETKPEPQNFLILIVQGFTASCTGKSGLTAFSQPLGEKMQGLSAK